MRELDRFELTENGAAFARWLYRWKRRWVAGDRIRVRVARDGTHAIVIADPDAPRPGPFAVAVRVQLELDVEP